MRFWNRLPDVPLDPKMLKIDQTEFAERMVAYNRAIPDGSGQVNKDILGTNQLERSFQHPVPSGAFGQGAALFRADLIEPSAVNPAPSVAASRTAFQRLWKKRHFNRLGVEQQEVLSASAPERARIQHEAELRYIAERSLPQADFDLLFPPQAWLDEDAATAAATGAPAPKGVRGASRMGAKSRSRLGRRERPSSTTAPDWLLKGNLMEGLLNTDVKNRAAAAFKAAAAASSARENVEDKTQQSRQAATHAADATFAGAAKITQEAVAGTLRHSKAPTRRAVEVLELVPDTERWVKTMVQVQFDRDPLPLSRLDGAGDRLRARAEKKAGRTLPAELRYMAELEAEIKREASHLAAASSPSDRESQNPDSALAGVVGYQAKYAQALEQARRDVISLGLLREQHDPIQDQTFFALYLPREVPLHRDHLEKVENGDDIADETIFEWVSEFAVKMEQDVVDTFLVELPEPERNANNKRPSSGAAPGDAVRVTRKARYTPLDARMTLPKHHVKKVGHRGTKFPFARPECLRVHHATGLRDESLLENFRGRLSEVMEAEEAASQSFKVMTADELLAASSRPYHRALVTSADGEIEMGEAFSHLSQEQSQSEPRQSRSQEVDALFGDDE